MSSLLARYNTAFSNLGRYKSKGGNAPHKPALLLAVLDLVESGHLTGNLIPLDAALQAAYKARWSELVDSKRASNIQYPFFFLASEGF